MKKKKSKKLKLLLQFSLALIIAPIAFSEYLFDLAKILTT